MRVDPVRICLPLVSESSLASSSPLLDYFELDDGTREPEALDPKDVRQIQPFNQLPATERNDNLTKPINLAIPSQVIVETL